MEPDLIHIDVGNLQGVRWSERWTKDKLAYFILMSDVDKPKFERTREMEWVPYDCNLYKWTEAALSREEFDRLITQWPGREPIPFDPPACDSVQFVSRTADKSIGFGFDPARSPELFERIVQLTAGRLQYEDFSYPCARHVFVAEINAATAAAFMKVAEVELRREHRRYAPTLKRIPRSRMEVRFLCREGSFEPPYGVWYEA